MHSLVLLIIFGISNVYYVKGEGEDPCKNYIDCFNCTFSGTAKCEWSVGSCKADSNPSIPFDSKYDKCDDANSELVKQTYCGPSTIEEGDGKDRGTSLPEVNGAYGTSSIVCKYTFVNNDEKKNILLNVKQRRGIQDNCIIYFEVRFFDGSMADRTVDRFDYLVSVEKGREIALYYFSKTPFTQRPFVINVKTEKPGISITLIITIILVIVAFIICSVSIFLFSKRLARRNAHAHRNMMVGIVVNQQGVPVSQQESEEDFKKRKAKQLEQLLKESMIQRNFNEDLGKFNLNCTICLDEYTTKSIVCLTSCNHVFHYDCITAWLTKNLLNSKCPNCNFHLLPELQDPNNVTSSAIVQNVFVSSARQNNLQIQPMPNVPYNSINANNIPQSNPNANVNINPNTNIIGGRVGDNSNQA